MSARQIGVAMVPMTFVAVMDPQVTEQKPEHIKYDFPACIELLSCPLNIVDTDTGLLLGLDILRHLRLQPDPVNNVCWQWNADRTVRRLVPMCQCESSGSLAIRIDCWELAVKQGARAGQAVPQLQEFELNRLRKWHAEDVLGEEDELAVAYNAVDHANRSRWTYFRPIARRASTMSTR